MINFLAYTHFLRKSSGSWSLISRFLDHNYIPPKYIIRIHFSDRAHRSDPIAQDLSAPFIYLHVMSAFRLNLIAFALNN